MQGPGNRTNNTVCSERAMFSLFPASLIIHVTDCYPGVELFEILCGLPGHIPAGELLCTLWKTLQIKCMEGV